VRWFVWRYSEPRWTLWFGSDRQASANQIRDALNRAERDEYTFFEVYPGSWRLDRAFEVIGQYQGRQISWGWAGDIRAADHIVRALSGYLRPDVTLALRRGGQSVTAANW